MNSIVLPKTDREGLYYLSYSQITLWKRSKREYVRKYFFGEKDDNVGLQRYGDFGSKVGLAFETNDYSGFELDEQEFLKSIPRYDSFETELKLQMEGYHVLGYADSTSKEEDGYVKRLLDYKTGSVLDRRADYDSEDYIQTEIYSAALLQKYGKIPDEIYIFLIGRSGNGFKGEELKLTKEVLAIPKKMSLGRIQKVTLEVQKVAEEISKCYKTYLKLSEL